MDRTCLVCPTKQSSGNTLVANRRLSCRDDLHGSSSHSPLRVLGVNRNTFHCHLVATRASAVFLFRPPAQKKEDCNRTTVEEHRSTKENMGRSKLYTKHNSMLSGCHSADRLSLESVRRSGPNIGSKHAPRGRKRTDQGFKGGVAPVTETQQGVHC